VGRCLKTNHLFAQSTQPALTSAGTGCVHKLAPVGNMAGAFFLPDTAPGTPAKVIEDVKEETVSCVQ